jgi:hypothetical protein
MDKRKILISNGCSFTAGDEISSPKGPIHTIDNNKFNYANKIAEHFNWHHIQLAEGGSSNDRISRTTLEYLETQKDYFENNIVVLIGWTSIFRSELYYNNFYKKITANKHHRYKNTELEDWYNNWQTFNCEEIQAMQNKLDNIILMKNYLENNKIPFVFHNTIDGLNPIKTKYYSQDNLLNLRLQNIEKLKNFFLSKQSFRDLMKIYNWKNSGQHPDKNAHENYAKLMIDFINTLDF